MSLGLWKWFWWHNTDASLTQDDAHLTGPTNYALLLALTNEGPATASVLVSASAALTQADATLAATASVSVGISASLTQADAALSASVAVAVGASAALTQADAALAATVQVTVGAAAALSQTDFSLLADISVVGSTPGDTGPGTGDYMLLLALTSEHAVATTTPPPPDLGGTGSGAGGRRGYSAVTLRRVRKLRKRLETLEDIARRLESEPEWSVELPAPAMPRDYLTEAHALVAELQAVAAENAAAAQMLVRAKELEDQFEMEAAAILLLLH